MRCGEMHGGACGAMHAGKVGNLLGGGRFQAGEYKIETIQESQKFKVKHNGLRYSIPSSHYNSYCWADIQWEDHIC